MLLLGQSSEWMSSFCREEGVSATGKWCERGKKEGVIQYVRKLITHRTSHIVVGRRIIGLRPDGLSLSFLIEQKRTAAVLWVGWDSLHMTVECEDRVMKYAPVPPLART